MEDAAGRGGGRGTHEDESVQGAALQAEAHDGALLPEDQRRKLRHRLAVHVMPVNLVQHIPDAHLTPRAILEGGLQRGTGAWLLNAL